MHSVAILGYEFLRSTPIPDPTLLATFLASETREGGEGEQRGYHKTLSPSAMFVLFHYSMNVPGHSQLQLVPPLPNTIVSSPRTRGRQNTHLTRTAPNLRLKKSRTRTPWGSKPPGVQNRDCLWGRTCEIYRSS
jgi:hypothetical protein